MFRRTMKNTRRRSIVYIVSAIYSDRWRRLIVEPSTTRSPFFRTFRHLCSVARISLPWRRAWTHSRDPYREKRADTDATIYSTTGSTRCNNGRTPSYVLFLHRFIRRVSICRSTNPRSIRWIFLAPNLIRCTVPVGTDEAWNTAKKCN